MVVVGGFLAGYPQKRPKMMVVGEIITGYRHVNVHQIHSGSSRPVYKKQKKFAQKLYIIIILRFTIIYSLPLIETELW